MCYAVNLILCLGVHRNISLQLERLTKKSWQNDASNIYLTILAAWIKMSGLWINPLFSGHIEKLLKGI